MDDNKSINHPHLEMNIINTSKSQIGLNELKFFKYLNNINDNVSLKLFHFGKNLKDQS